MSDLMKIETSRAGRGAGLLLVPTIVILLIALQMTYILKYSVTFGTILASAPFGIIAP